MKKILIIYWSGTGNTAAMAEEIAAGAREKGADPQLVSVDKANTQMVASAELIALGCPSMGVEVLEESDMEPFIASLKSEDVKGKALALFGSYDWGDGQWMRDWEDRMKRLGANLVQDGFIVQNEPDDEAREGCRKLGVLLASQ